MSPTQMRERCPASMPAGLAFLLGWRVIINSRGFANIVRESAKQQQQSHSHHDRRGGGGAEGDEGDGDLHPPAARPQTTARDDASEPGGVYGILYGISSEDEASLDLAEGVPWAYQKTELDVLLVPAGGTGTGGARRDGFSEGPQEEEEEGEHGAGT
ncbi:hypothetical protein NKR23_g2872 [Pleurostoma richardsiae]|uniref:Gamma-glutamylcyclotransferase AIG2-like domain-containing protein n=1 Tax=Pleurostoma richardsiae TaxID=41990 RepID=A0AA38VXQ7_9PEZI|nr:hypothetical protein NKR23_g2872 [Pleurostoma richardsiae]